MISIITVGYNCVEDIRVCLGSVYHHAPSGAFEVIYVDNGSVDGSVDVVRKEFPRTHVVANRHNAGFQRANNQGLARAKGDEVVLLNPDTRVLPGTLDILVGFLRAHDAVGAASPRCVYPDGRLQWAVAPFPSLPIIRRWFWSAHPGLARLLRRAPPTPPAAEEVPTQEQAYAYGACFAVKREVVEAVGPLDEGFFLAAGEIAWSRHIQRAGWRVFYVAEAVLEHREGASRKRRSWMSELDWVNGHRKILYSCEGLMAGVLGDVIFSTHLLLFAAGRALGVASRVSRPPGATV